MDNVVEVGRRGPVAVVTLDRGKVNAVDARLLDGLAAALDTLEHDDDVRAVTLTGAGRVFSAGVDLTAVLEGGRAYVERLIAGLRDGLERLFTFPKPMVAAINGAAVAGGCVMACACDRRLIAEGARIGASELVVGVPFPVAAVEIVRHACGPRAEDAMFSGMLFDAHAAAAIGMVHEVVPPGALLPRATTVAAELGVLAPAAFRLAKEQLRRPAVERMRADAPANDGEAVRQWASEATMDRIRAQLDRLGTAR